MKKISLFVVALVAAVAPVQVMAEESAESNGVEFAYEAGAELVSSYVWRGQYLGGLSIQPTVTVGFESEHLNFQGGIWASLGASDWGFRKGLEQDEDYNPNTYFVPELDVILSFQSHGVTLGLTHYYYCDGGKFFGWKKPEKWGEDYYSNSTTELTLGYNFSEVLPENHNFYLNWNTMVAGNDFKLTNDDEVKNNYSSYLEIGYDYTFENAGVTLGAQMGIVPWASDYYGTEKGTVTNLSLRLGKTWEFDACELELFGLGSINPYMVKNDRESVFVKASGDDKIECQSLNGTIGLGIWF